MKDKRGTL